MGTADYLKRGSFNAICDICGRKCKAEELRRTWAVGKELTNLLACPDCWDAPNPQAWVKGRKDYHKLPFTRPDPPPVFLVGEIVYSRSINGAPFNYFSLN